MQLRPEKKKNRFRVTLRSEFLWKLLTKIAQNQSTAAWTQKVTSTSAKCPNPRFCFYSQQITIPNLIQITYYPYPQNFFMKRRKYFKDKVLGTLPDYTWLWCNYNSKWPSGLLMLLIWFWNEIVASADLALSEILNSFTSLMFLLSPTNWVKRHKRRVLESLTNGRRQSKRMSTKRELAFRFSGSLDLDLRLTLI